MKKTLLLLNLLWAPLFLFAQEGADAGDAPNRLEITTSGFYSYSLDDKDGVPGAEIHGCLWLGDTDLGLGLAYGTKFEENANLSDMSLLLSYEAEKWLTINTGLNVGFPKSGYREVLTPGFYFEGEWNYEIHEKFHIGLMTGAILGKEAELTFGIQAGIKF